MQELFNRVARDIFCAAENCSFWSWLVVRHQSDARPVPGTNPVPSAVFSGVYGHAFGNQLRATTSLFFAVNGITVFTKAGIVKSGQRQLFN